VQFSALFAKWEIAKSQALYIFYNENTENAIFFAKKLQKVLVAEKKCLPLHCRKTKSLFEILTHKADDNPRVI
jgi:hypothetical protein